MRRFGGERHLLLVVCEAGILSASDGSMSTNKIFEECRMSSNAIYSSQCTLLFSITFFKPHTGFSATCICITLLFCINDSSHHDRYVKGISHSYTKLTRFLLPARPYQFGRPAGFNSQRRSSRLVCKTRKIICDLWLMNDCLMSTEFDPENVDYGASTGADRDLDAGRADYLDVG